MPASPLNQNAMAILMALNPEAMTKAKATNVVIGQRSITFNLPDGCKDGVNRVKITNSGNGTMRVHLQRLEEIDLVDSVPPEKLQEVLKNFVGIDA